MANNKHENEDEERKRREEEDKRKQEEDKRQREEQQRQQRSQQQSPENQAAAEKMAAEQREAAGAASIGAQIILDYNSDAGKGARGGIGGTMTENQQARDAYLVSVGLDPVAPSGPPLGSAEALQAQREAMAPRPQFVPSTSSKATRMSSLAAGIEEGDLPEPPVEPPPTTRGGAA